MDDRPNVFLFFFNLAIIGRSTVKSCGGVIRCGTHLTLMERTEFMSGHVFVNCKFSLYCRRFLVDEPHNLFTVAML